MPELPELNYSRVVIHDNFEALYRFAKIKGKERPAYGALMTFNGRFIAFNLDNVTLISIGMGSAQTNCLVENLSNKKCQVIIKVGTCSALDSRLCEGDLIIPLGALIDEGATYWKQIKLNHDKGRFNNQSEVNKYIKSKKFVQSNENVRKRLIAKCKQYRHSLQMYIKNSFVWSVDSYDCFDGSPQLYSKVDGKEFEVEEFLSGENVSINILGVEMECSALFSSNSCLKSHIHRAAIIVIFRSRERLIQQNIDEKEYESYKISKKIPSRNIEAIRKNEIASLEVAVEVAKLW